MMNENVFRQAPLCLLHSFKVGENVMLTTFQVGNPAICYRLAVRIVSKDQNELEGIIIKVGTLGDALPAHPFYKMGDHVTFNTANVLGSAAEFNAKE